MKLHSAALGILLISGVLVQLNLRGHPCFPRLEIVTRLQEKFDESLRGLGYNFRENLVELWVRDAEGDYGPSWTILVTLPDGNSCVVQTGTTWSVIPHVFSKKRTSR